MRTAREGTRYAALPKCARLREGPLDGVPLTFGVARPTVVLTPGLGGAELACVLVHEGVHARRRDNLWHYATAAALTVFWWNPAVWLMARLIRRDVELSCDRAAVRRLGAERRAEYAAALVTLSTQAEGGAFCQGFGPKRTEERIIAIMKYKKTTWAGIALAMVLVLSMTVVFASTPEDVSTPDLGGVLPATLLYEKWQYEDAENMISAVSETDVPAIELWGSCRDKDMMDLMEAQGLDETMPLSSDLIVNSTLRAYETSRGRGSLRFNISSVRPYFKIYIYNSGSETLHVSMTYQSKDNTSLWNYDIAAGKSYTGVWMANQFGNFYLNFTSKPSGNSLQGNVSIRVSSNVLDLT